MDIDLMEDLRVSTQEILSNIDQQMVYLSQEYETFIKHVESEKESLKRVKSLDHQMDLFIAHLLGVTVHETDDVKAKIEAVSKEKKNEFDSLKHVYDANTAVKNDKKAKLTDLKSYVDGLKSKRAQLKRESANEALVCERFLMRHLGINFKMSKDDSVVAVIYKNSSKNNKTVEKLISVDKENRDVNDVKEDFWRSINKAIENDAPIKKLQAVVSTDTLNIQSVN